MGYMLYTDEELAHSLKGSSWKNHKYIDKFFKNGKWVYIYKGEDGKVPEINSKPTKREYTQINKNGTVTHVKEYTRNGNSWLSKRREVKGKDSNHVTVYKEKGKIAQHIEKKAAKGKSFIESLTAKANKVKDSVSKKKKKKSNIKVTHTTYLK